MIIKRVIIFRYVDCWLQTIFIWIISSHHLAMELTLTCQLCEGPHPTEKHKCRACGKTGAISHQLIHCPYVCKICFTPHHPTSLHTCSYCGSGGLLSHRDYECPLRFMKLKIKYAIGKCIICGANGEHATFLCFARCQICSGYHTTEQHKCYLCGQRDHKEIDCPRRCVICRQPHLTAEHKCGICGCEGPDSHPTLNCPHRCQICSYSTHIATKHVCSICGLVGPDSHCESECPQRCQICPQFFVPTHNTSQHQCPICGSDSHNEYNCVRQCRFCVCSHLKAGVLNDDCSICKHNWHAIAEKNCSYCHCECKSVIKS